MRTQITNLIKIIGLYGLGVLPAYFLASYLSYFHAGFYPFILFSLTFQMLCGMFFVLFLGEKWDPLRDNLRLHWLSLVILLTVFCSILAAAFVSWQYPELFNHRAIFMEADKLPLFGVLSVLSAIGTILLVEWLERRPDIYASLRSTSLFRWIQNNFAGILLSAFFLLQYLILAQTLNFPGYRTIDQYFDMDISAWIQLLTYRQASELEGSLFYVRAVHPAVMLILRPGVELISLFLHGDRLQAAFLLSSMAGAACVLLVWLIVKRRSNSTYALLWAAILGASASHLLLSSILETYIFTALALIAFVFLLESGRTALKYTIPAGMVIFGITITNLVQACILYFFKLPRLKTMILFTGAVISLVLLLNRIQVRWVPDAKPLYQPSNLSVEQQYRYDLFEKSWRFTGRVNLISRAIFLYGAVAPTPFVLTHEMGSELPNFRTFQIVSNEFRVASYRGWGDVAVSLWIVLLATAFVLFGRNFLRSPAQNLTSLSLLICLGFNWGLHIVYGDDPLLYSADWVYALILFVAFSLVQWADKRWLQLILLVFLGLMIYTNLGLVQQIMAVSLPFYGR